MLSLSFVLVLLLAASALADNDWSKPCFSGVCQYDLPATNGSASGTLKIWGPNTAISDITPAAGWNIIGCSPDALKQDIRLVCNGNSTDCAHLYSGTGNSKNAVGKLVRLPENCGKSAFAVVTNAYVAQDQSVPSSVSHRDGTKPTVQGLSIDTNFSSAGTPASGPVNFAIRAANVPGANGDLATTPQQQRRSNSRIFGRGAVSDFVTGAVNDISSLNDFNVDKSTTLSPVDVDKSFNLLDKSISCPPVDASVKVDADAKAHAVASIGVAASGTILPPEVTAFSLIAGLTADLDGSIDMQATASGTLDSGKIKLFEVGIPGLDFPGVLTIGPSFVINGQATATLDLDVGLTVGISYTIDNAQLTFPPSSQQSSGAFNIGDTPLKLTAGATGKATGTVEAHLIPTLNFGISALDDTVSANVFLELDASATMTLTVQGEADASGTVQSRSELESSKSRRGYYLLSPSSLNTRAPQSDDGEDDSDDAEDGEDGEDDSAEDDSAAEEDGSAGDDAGADAEDDDSQDDSTDGSDDASGDDSTDVADNSDSSADTGTGDDDGLTSDATDDSSDVGDSTNDNSDDSGDADTNDDGSDSGGDDTSTAGDDAADADNGDDSEDSTTTDDGSDSTDPATADPPAGDTDADNTDTTDDTNTDTADDTNTDGDDSDSADATSATLSATSGDDSASASATSTDTGETAAATSPSGSKVALTDTSANASLGGCFDIEGALDVNAGADGSFFGLFDKNTKVELFSKKFEILKKCFGSGTDAARRDVTSSTALRSRLSSRFFLPSHGIAVKKRDSGLTCSPAGDAQQQDIADQTVSASSITQL
ncbi:hypothetical protein CVT25_008563 [Psilocybe cyanescens]|uniref:Uncharacterized protein n=1 Tax=Psilocybe cyanescens TaxID=93625 RepID=A0A409XRL5_PSICY|nr:hypothetical protein CVT25_008563 [Psilocybe cyanescens]